MHITHVLRKASKAAEAAVSAATRKSMVSYGYLRQHIHGGEAVIVCHWTRYPACTRSSVVVVTLLFRGNGRSDILIL